MSNTTQASFIDQQSDIASIDEYGVVIAEHHQTIAPSIRFSGRWDASHVLDQPARIARPRLPREREPAAEPRVDLDDSRFPPHVFEEHLDRHWTIGTGEGLAHPSHKLLDR